MAPVPVRDQEKVTPVQPIAGSRRGEEGDAAKGGAADGFAVDFNFRCIPIGLGPIGIRLPKKKMGA